MLGLPIPEPHGILVAWDACESAGFTEPTEDLRMVISQWSHADRQYLANGTGPRTSDPRWVDFYRICMTVYAVERGGYAIGVLRSWSSKWSPEIYVAMRRITGKWSWEPMRIEHMNQSEVDALSGLWRKKITGRIQAVNQGARMAEALGAIVIPGAKFGASVLKKPVVILPKFLSANER